MFHPNSVAVAHYGALIRALQKAFFRHALEFFYTF
ncbi:MAG: DUF6783 domain-containing protein [Lachnospiraceae bacterium]|nr:DUF6783 domain-containing protein [Lachnospiraceae bacterium]